VEEKKLNIGQDKKVQKCELDENKIESSGKKVKSSGSKSIVTVAEKKVEVIETKANKDVSAKLSTPAPEKKVGITTVKSASQKNVGITTAKLTAINVTAVDDKIKTKSSTISGSVEGKRAAVDKKNEFTVPIKKSTSICEPHLELIENEDKYLHMFHPRMQMDEVYAVFRENFDSIKPEMELSQIEVSLKKVKRARRQLWHLISIEEYIKVIREHFRVFGSLGINMRTQRKLYQSLFTGMELRLVDNDNTRYWNTGTERQQDIDDYVDTVRRNVQYRRHISVYTTNDLCNVLNPAMAYIGMPEMLKRVYVNPYGMQTVVYCETKQVDANKDSNAAYAFYKLRELTADGRRIWRMDNRLEDESCVWEDVKNYCAKLFKKVYRAAFCHNRYITDFETRPESNAQLKQLSENMILMASEIGVAKQMMAIIREYSRMEKTDLDIFDETRDRLDVKKRYKEHVIDNDLKYDLGKLMFTEIEETEAVDFYNRTIRTVPTISVNIINDKAKDEKK
jgi:hypothetical protein